MIRQSIEHEGAITMEDVARVLRIKHESLGKGGTLQMVTDVETLDRVGGQSRVKKWLELRARPSCGAAGTEALDVPKGMLLLGVQGAGKSLAARAVAGSWGVPLLRLDFGALYNKFHGETERNLRAALETAAQMAPCILWLDEIEKGVAAGDARRRRRLAPRAGHAPHLDERARDRVFLIATANDIASLPPELLRKGRFDEIFFVDLPDAEVRAEIFRIHLARARTRGALRPRQARRGAERFSGAEIEQSIVAAAYCGARRGQAARDGAHPRTRSAPRARSRCCAPRKSRRCASWAMAAPSPPTERRTTPWICATASSTCSPARGGSPATRSASSRTASGLDDATMQALAASSTSRRPRSSCPRPRRRRACASSRRLRDALRGPSDARHRARRARAARVAATLELEMQAGSSR
jgi:SpoVK/Ycf46/Vps4 family AAA+-type ATPase